MSELRDSANEIAAYRAVDFWRNQFGRGDRPIVDWADRDDENAYLPRSIPVYDQAWAPAPRTWSADELGRASSDVAQVGSLFNVLVPGDRLPTPTTRDEALTWFDAVRGAPDRQSSIYDFATARGLTLQQFQAQYQGLPVRFEADGTPIWDPSARKHLWDNSRNDDWLFKVGPLAFGALVVGGLGGFLPGTESVFGAAGSVGAAEASAMAAEFSLAAPGTGIGGVGTAGTGAGLGLALTGGNVIVNTGATLANAAGVTLDAAIAGSGAGAGLAVPSAQPGILDALRAVSTPTSATPANQTSAALTNALKQTASVAGSVGTLASVANQLSGDTMAAKPQQGTTTSAASTSLIPANLPDWVKYAVIGVVLIVVVTYLTDAGAATKG